MESERWSEADALFAAALELTGEDRAAFLERVGRTDAELRAIVEGLLAADERAESFLELPAVHAAADEPRLAPGLTFGPYRLEWLISRGGMGTVYAASRDDGQFERRVAIKLLHRGTTDPRALQRFRDERQILARLEHPSIARLYDGGETEHGIPFLVMEYVQGQPLDLYCDRRRLGVDDRLRLCRRLFDAVAFAHQNLLVHGDIKPSNILVTSQGELKLLDFGIARRLGGNAERDSDPATPRAMTPGYASPEQVRGEAITTASDVYSLGIVLRDLLRGHRPDRAGETGPRPDAGGPRRGRAPSGDLLAIVAKAVQEDPRQRFASVTELAADVDRYLRTQPVTARPQTPAYLAGKLLHRHRVGATLVAVALGLILGLLVSLERQRDRAGHERDKAREALAFLTSVFERADPYQLGAENVSARDVLEAGAERASRELTGDPEVQAALLGAIGQAAVGLRQLADAEPLLERALALNRQTAPDSVELADSLESLGWVRFLSSEYEAAEALYREALALRTRLAGRGSPQVARTLNSLGTVLGERYQSTDAARSREIEGLHREALRIFEQTEGPDSLGVAHTLFRLAKLMQDRGESAEAERLSRENVRITALCHGEDHPETAMSLRLLALILIDRVELDAAEEALRRAFAAQRRTLPEGHPDTLLTLNDLAVLHHRKGEPAEAEVWLREALAAYVAAYGEAHAHTAVVMTNLASSVLAQGRAEEAAALHERALEIKLEVFGERHAFVLESLNGLARAYSGLGRHADALELAERSLALSRETVGPAHPTFAKSLAAVGQALHRGGQSQAAEPYLRQSLELFRDALPPGHFQTARAQVRLGACLSALGRLDEAEPLLLRGRQGLAARYPASHLDVRQADEELAALYRVRGRPASSVHADS